MTFKTALRKRLGEEAYAVHEARLEAQRTEIRRLYALPDRWLAKWLVLAARQLRSRPDFRWGPFDCVYDASFLWQIVPEVAYRLGERRLEEQERSRPEIRDLCGQDLRTHAGLCLRNLAVIEEAPDEKEAPFAHLLGRTPCNGNPVAFALDRMHPPRAADALSQSLIEVAPHRGRSTAGAWVPGF